MKKFFQNMNMGQLRSNVSMLSVIGIFIFIFLIAFKKIPLENKDLMYMASGALISHVGSIYNWLFGSSKNEVDKQKDETNK
jgi:hypothetical protein